MWWRCPCESQQCNIHANVNNDIDDEVDGDNNVHFDNFDAHNVNTNVHDVYDVDSDYDDVNISEDYIFDEYVGLNGDDVDVDGVVHDDVDDYEDFVDDDICQLKPDQF